MGTQGEVVVGTDMPLPFHLTGDGRTVLYNMAPEADHFKFVTLSEERSSLLDRMAFDSDTGLLFVVLRSDRSTVYVYRTSLDRFLHFLAAPSMGATYNRSFRGMGVGRYTADDIVSAPRLRNPIREG